ncbi:hypothetical protein [Mycobacterium sp. MUNTM1]
MTIPFDPVARKTTSFAAKVDGKEVSVKLELPPPLEKTAPAPIWQTILVRFVVILMVSLFALMLAMGLRQFNPMYMMGIFAMVGMAGIGGGHLLGGGKNPSGELNLMRQDYVTGLREQRRNAHAINKHIHATQTSIYPHPDSLAARCGVPTEMWTTQPPMDTPSIGDSREQTEVPQTNPWGSARIGVGYRRTEPYITPGADKAPETYEPVTAASYMRFIRTQNVITNCPIGVDIFSRAFIVCAGDPDRLIATSRAMICSLAANHSPRHLQIGIITDDVAEWDWLKWLPHCSDPSRRDQSGQARLHWFSLEEYAADQRNVIASKGPHTATHTRNEATPHRVIFVDIPGQDPDIPVGVTSAGVADHTFVYVRHS